MPPKWLENQENRLTVIEVDLDELRLFFQPEDLMPAFYQSTSYFVSFHPNSESEQSITLPHEVPEPGKTVNGEYMVSKLALAKRPLVQLQQYGANAVVSQFLDSLALQRNHIDWHIVAYVWGVRSSPLKSEKAVLLGRAILPMTEWKLQRQMVPWSVVDIPTGQLVGEMVMKFEVLTTPDPPRQQTLRCWEKGGHAALGAACKRPWLSNCWLQSGGVAAGTIDKAGRSRFEKIKGAEKSERPGPSMGDALRTH